MYALCSADLGVSMHCRISILEVADRENCMDGENCAHCRMLMLDVADRENSVHSVRLTLVSVCIARLGFRISN